MKSLYILVILAWLSTSFTAFAAVDHSRGNVLATKQEPTDMTAKPNELVLEVHGIVCSFCSVGVQKKLSKLPFVDHSKYKKGVHVAIKKHRVTVAIKPDSNVTKTNIDIKAAYKSVQSGGYEPIRATVMNGEGKVTFYNKKGGVCSASC